MGRSRELALQSDLEPWLNSLGFKTADRCQFVRNNGSNKEILYFAVKAYPLRRLSLSYHAHLRLNDVAMILGDENMESETYPTIGWPHHLIPPAVSFFEWEANDAATWKKATKDVKSHAERKAIPLFQWFEDRAILFAELQSSSWITSFLLSPEQRVAVVAGLLCTFGRRSEAIDFLKAEIASRRDQPAKRRFALQRLLARLDNSNVAV